PICRMSTAPTLAPGGRARGPRGPVAAVVERGLRMWPASRPLDCPPRADFPCGDRDEARRSPTVAATKREREQARKRQQKWEQRRAQARARRQRTVAIVAIIAVLALVGGGLVVANLGNAADAAPEAEGACPAATPGARSGPGLPDPSAAEDRTWTATLDLCAGGTESQLVVELDG